MTVGLTRDALGQLRQAAEADGPPASRPVHPAAVELPASDIARCEPPAGGGQ